MRRVGEHGINRVGASALPLNGDVIWCIGPDGRRTGSDRVFHSSYTRQGLDIDGNHRSRVGGLRRGLCDNERDRLAYIPDSALRKTRPGGIERLAQFESLERYPANETNAGAEKIVAGQNSNHAGHFYRYFGVNAPQRAMGVVRSDERGVRLTGDIDVVGVAAPPGDKSHVFTSSDRTRYSVAVFVVRRTHHNPGILQSMGLMSNRFAMLAFHS
jgi:hypothetical protein